MKSRQGAELSMNVIIIAALGVLVLLLLVFFLAGGFTKFSQSQECEKAHDGVCADKCPAPGPKGTYDIPSVWGCANKEQVCCTRLGG